MKIWGRGSEKARVVFIGQAPGAEEDRRDKCFVGPAGQLLTQAISRYEIKPAYITNLAKCFPPGDRDPKKNEIEACSGYLFEELELIKPEYVVTLGNVATQALTGKKGIQKLAGRLIKGAAVSYDVFPMLHPSFILRYPQNLADFERGFKRLRQILNGEQTDHDAQVVPATTLDEARRLLQKAPFGVAFDYETTGIVSQHDLGRVRCVAFATGAASFWVRADEDGFNEFMVEFLTSDTKKVAHNSTFERRVSKAEFGVWPKNLIEDTLAMHSLLDNNSKHGLKEVCETLLDAEPWDLGLQDDEWATADITLLGNYCRMDALWTFELYRKLEQQMSKKLQFVYRKIQIPLMRAAAEMEQDGVKIDVEWAATVARKYRTQQSVLQSNFLRFPVVLKFYADNNDSLNMNSNDQIRKIFVDRMKLPITEKTEGGQASVKEEVLEAFREKHVEVKTYLEWKKLQTYCQNFLDKFPTFVDADGFIRARINPCRVVSGRLSVTEPPLQAFPDEPEIRGMVVSRFREGQIMSFDYSQLEMRLVANMSGEPKLLRAFDKGEDVHDLTARLLFGKGFSSKQRSIAKRINFGIVYGISHWSLAAQFNMSEQEALGLVDRFNKEYAAVYVWMKKQHEFAEKNEFIESAFGRRRRFGAVKDMPEWQKAAVRREAGNFPIQAVGADLTNLSWVKARLVLKKAGMKSKLILQVHDSVLVDCHPKEVQDVQGGVRAIMEKVVPAQYDWLRVPIVVDVFHGPRWESWKMEKL